jgi:hypothetical protein
VLEQWLSSCPELELIALDIAPGRADDRRTVALSPWALRFAGGAEHALLKCLENIAYGNNARALDAALAARGEAREFPDLHLLAGALLLAAGQSAAATEPLRSAYDVAFAEGGQRHSEPLGSPTRRLYPQLRLLLRLAPTQLLPLYPDSYAAGLMLATALRFSGHSSDALDVLREVGAEFGYNDELRLVAAQILLQCRDADKAAEVIAESQAAERDALDLVRATYLALAHLQQGDLRAAAHALRASVLHTEDANPQTQARARLTLAQIYGRAGIPLEALRHSALLAAAELPADVARWLSVQEAEWVNQLAQLDPLALEQQARADLVTLHIPTREEVLDLDDKRVHVGSRDPLADLRATEMSWVKRREEEQQIDKLRSAAARGHAVSLGTPQLSPAAKALRRSIEQAQEWWQTRPGELLLSGGPELARPCPDCAHLRFDLRGNRAAPVYNLPGERRLERVSWVVTAALVILLALTVLRACSGGL